VTSGVGGTDQFVFRISQLREAPAFRDFHEQISFKSDDELPDLWFDLGYVEFVKDNYSRIQRSLERSPESFEAKQSKPLNDNVNEDGVVESGDQSKYVNSLEIRLKSSDADVKAKDAEIAKLKKQVLLVGNSLT
jgi:intracellular protein transport protein USO1